MIITFRRTLDGGHRVTASRDDEVTVLAGESDHPHRVPHELAHYVIERELSLEWGFWGCVSRGALFREMAVLGGMSEDAAAELSAAVRQEAGSRFDTAEVLVSALEKVFAHHRDLSPDAQREKMVELQPVLAAAPLAQLDLGALAAAVDGAVRMWQEVSSGGEIALEWNRIPSESGAPLR